MRKTYKMLLCTLIVAAMLLTVLAGCGNTSGSQVSGSQVSDSQSEPTPSPDSDTPDEPEESDEPTVPDESQEPAVPTVEDLEPDADGNVTITDMAGRTVTFPANPTVWNSSPTAEGWLCAIIPDQIIGFASEFNEQQLSYWPEEVRELPVIGGNFGNSQANVEGILAYSPDVIINTFDCSEGALASTVASADAMSEQYDIPVVVISRDIADTAEVAGLVGLWFGQAQRGAEVQAYLQGVLDEINETVSAVPEDAIPTYYYAEGTDGLSTESSDSIHSDVYIYIGLKAAVGDDVTLTNMGGMEAVSLEQVLQWNPEYIFVWNPGAYQSIIHDDAWSDITAIQNGNVYLNPTLPQNWVDRSPNSLRILGCLYYAAICYADYCTYDYQEEIVNFFDYMYGVQLTEDQLSALFVSMQ